MNKNRPRARKTFSSGSGHSGGGFGGGSSHSSSSHSSGGGFFSSGSGGGGYSGGSGGSRNITRSPGGCLIVIFVIVLLVFGGGSLGLSGLLGGGQNYQETITTNSGTTNGWYEEDENASDLDTSVDSQARDKYITPKGDGKDVVTVMVYMCGTDLESKSAAATRDLNEMINASIDNENLNLIVYTGGCKQWRNNVISSKYNQVWQIRDGNVKCIESNAGNPPMTKPDTLSAFIKWTNKKYPSDRPMLVFWDHGGGSIGGYGFDEKYPQSGSMSLTGIKTALDDSNIKFDFIGFDTCLMGTTETALMLDEYADYMIGSEETEPGIGWYHTGWLNQLNKNTSTPTLDLGKIIVDDFTAKCANQCPGQATTLSVVDLAELSQTVPSKLNAFSEETSEKISNNEFKEVAIARSGAKEFAKANNLDQIDLVHFAKLMDSKAAYQLSEALLGAIKYNKTSKSVANAYGLSIYFPYKTLNKVDYMTDTYKAIGMNKSYASCIQKFAQMEVSGQAVAGGGFSPFEALSGSSGQSNNMDTQAIEQLIGQLFGGGYNNFGRVGLASLDDTNTNFLENGPLDVETAASYIEQNQLSAKALQWKRNDDGRRAIILTEEQWDLVQTVDMQMYYDNGKGYLDLGLDNIFDFDDDGNLLPRLDRTWISLDGQIVAYYHTETLEKGNDQYSITGYVPVKLNGEDARLILVFDNKNEQGYVAGVSYDYDEEITETAAKALPGLSKGDMIQFICNSYDYDGTFKDHYRLSREMKVEDPDGIEITNEDIGKGNVKIIYRFTDIYGKDYWTPAISY